MKKIFFTFITLCIHVAVIAQPTFPNNGPADRRDGKYAFTNATLVKSWNEKIEGAILIISKGKIEAIGKGIAIPPDAVKINLNGKYIYPAFIELFSDYGMPEPKAEGSPSASRPQMLSNKKGAYAWNEALKTDFNASEAFVANSEKAKNLKSVGFGAALVHRFDGMSRGIGTLVSLADVREHEAIIKANTAHLLSFQKGTSTQDYPNSLMGGIALLRQTYYDAQWYKKQQEEYNTSLEAWNNAMSLPQIFAVGGVLEGLRAQKIAKEFNLSYILKGTGDEYKRLTELKATGASLIIPVKFPEAYDVEDPYDALQVELSDLKHWELAPTNPAKVAKAGINFALTSNGLKNTSDFLAALRKAVENGLGEDLALKALTQTPAEMIGAAAQLGTLDKDKYANFFISSGNIFNKDSKIYETWTNGKLTIVNDMNVPTIAGTYELSVEGNKYKLNVNNAEKPEIQAITNDTTKLKVEYSLGNGTIT